MFKGHSPAIPQQQPVLKYHTRSTPQTEQPRASNPQIPDHIKKSTVPSPSPSQRASPTYAFTRIIYPDRKRYTDDDGKTRQKGVSPPITKRSEHLLSKKRECESEQ
jgi:hypothetical protein